MLPVYLPGHILTGSRCFYFKALFHEIKPFCTHGECVSLSVKEQTDSDPEPSSVQRLVAGTVSGFKWESSVGYIHSLLMHIYGICTYALFLVISKTYPQADYGAVTAVNFHSSCSTGVKTPHFQNVSHYVLHYIVAPLTLSL